MCVLRHNVACTYKQTTTKGHKVIQMLGNIAAVLTTISFVPDALKAVRTKDVSGINPIMYTLFVSGVFLWLVYGFITRQPSLIGANGVTFAFSATTLFYKLKLDVIPSLLGKKVAADTRA